MAKIYYPELSTTILRLGDSIPNSEMDDLHSRDLPVTLQPREIDCPSSVAPISTSTLLSSLVLRDTSLTSVLPVSDTSFGLSTCQEVSSASTQLCLRGGNLPVKLREPLNPLVNSSRGSQLAIRTRPSD